MTNRNSIGFRLTAWYTAILAGTLAVAAVGMALALRRSIQETADKDLRLRLQVARDYVDREFREGGLAQVASELDEPSIGPAGAALQIVDDSGNWIYRSSETKNWSWSPPKRASLPEGGTIATLTVNGRSVRVLSAPIAVGAIQLGFPLDSFYDVLEDFSTTVLFASPVVLVLAALSGYWMSRRALRPVDTIVAAARRIGDGSLTERLPLSGSEDELQRLSVALNEMLARLETAFRKIRQFTADASHELRTPVAVVRTTAEVTRARVRGVDEHMKAWDSVVTHTQRMSQLIDDLLLLARADDRSPEMVTEVMDLAYAIREASSDMEVMARRRDLTLEARIPASCRILGDYEAIRRLISILLDNAIKFTPSGGDILVTLEIDDSFGRKTAVIRVRDTGVGISSDDLPRVFDRFYRTSKDRSRETGGAGLGLSIAQSIVTRHGGEIFAESAVGKGTTFQVQLPVASDRG